MELKRETLIKMKQNYQTKVNEKVFFELDSCTHKCIMSFMELFYKSLSLKTKPKLALSDYVKASVSIRLSRLKNS